MNSKIKPWAKGPNELIKHAQGHLKSGEDIDRLIALIGFDNAIEISIETFINLHPDMRDGFEISKERAKKALRNFHTKLEFFEEYLTTKNIRFKIPIPEIKWFHQQRNFLFHTGSGLVPELNVVEGAYIAAVSVFNALFKTNISTRLDKTAIQNITMHDSEANTIRKTIEQKGPYLIWQGKQNKNDYYFVGELPDGRYGLQVIVQRDQFFSERTAFVAKNGTLDATINFLKRFANPYSGDLPMHKIQSDLKK